MKEKDLLIDRTRHAVYTKKAKKCVLRLLHRNYDDQTCQQLWEKIQLQYETQNSLRERLSRMYESAEVTAVDGIACFQCRK